MKTPFQLKQRMYGLVPYNISPIQQGIQFGHAVVEYGLTQTQQDPTDTELSPYNQWAHLDKTFIILNGGTTNNSPIYDKSGTLNKALDELAQMGIQTATFYEPDLGDQLTAVVFLVDEHVWDREKYPEYDELIHEPVDEPNYYFNLFGDDTDKILGMREFVSQFRLA